VGVAFACAYAVVLGCPSIALGLRLWAQRWSLVGKIGVALLATGIAVGTVRSIGELIFDPAPDPGPDLSPIGPR
jgi:hypothetical protein